MATKRTTQKRPVYGSKRNSSQDRNKRFVTVIGVLLIAILGTLLLKAIFANPHSGGGSVSLGTSLFATHPYASKAGFDSSSVNYYTGQKLCTTGSFCPVGQLITDMQITDDGQLVAGYGDWNANVDSFGVAEGKVGIIPLNLNTNTWGSFTLAGSEALDNIRKIDGKIYAPTTDPSDTRGSKSGYVTNESGSWTVKEDGQGAEHLFDVATLNGTDRWEMGAVGDTSAVWRSPLNNGVWTREPRNLPGGLARYYWGQALNGKLYIGGAENAVFDGASWSSAPNVPCGGAAKRVVTYEGAIYCGNGNAFYSFSGSTSTTLLTFDGMVPYPGSTNTYTTEGVKDLYVDTTGLYVLSDLGKVYRVEPVTHAVKSLGTVTTGANTLAYYGGYLYFGYDQGKIYRTNNTLGSTAPPPAAGVMAASAINPNKMVLDGTTQNMTITGSGFPGQVLVKVGKTTAPVLSQTDSQLVVSVNTATVIKNERFRKSGDKYLTVSLSATGYTSTNAPSLFVSYTK